MTSVRHYKQKSKIVNGKRQILVNLKEGDTIFINIANTLFTEVKVRTIVYARKEDRTGNTFQITCLDLEDGQAFATVTIYA